MGASFLLCAEEFGRDFVYIMSPRKQMIIKAFHDKIGHASNELTKKDGPKTWNKAYWYCVRDLILDPSQGRSSLAKWEVLPWTHCCIGGIVQLPFIVLVCILWIIWFIE